MSVRWTFWQSAATRFCLLARRFQLNRFSTVGFASHRCWLQSRHRTYFCFACRCKSASFWLFLVGQKWQSKTIRLIHPPQLEAFYACNLPSPIVELYLLSLIGDDDGVSWTASFMGARHRHPLRPRNSLCFLRLCIRWKIPTADLFLACY